MKKIKGESEDRLEIYVNGIPDLTSMPKDEFNALIAVLGREIYKIREKKKKSDNTRRNKEWIKRY